jgi:hypothetical protein
VALIGAGVAVMLLVVNFYQSCATRDAANAALEAVGVARDARDDSDISSGDTLIQMKAQNRAMHRSAEAMSSAATSSSAQASSMKQMSQATLDQVTAAKEQKDISANQLQAFRTQTELATRPWISITNPEVVGPIRFGANSALLVENIVMGVKFKIANVGNSPATHIQIWPQMHLLNRGNRVQEACSKAIEGLGMQGKGGILWPGDSWHPDDTYGAGVQRSEIAEFLNMKIPNIGPNQYIFPSAVTACVAYESALPPGSAINEPYYTGVVYDIIHFGTSLVTIDSRSKELPDKVQLREDFGGFLTK